MPGEAADLWRRLDGLIDRAPSEEDLRSHRLEIPAARRFRSTGRSVPADFVAQERLGAVAALGAPLLLRRIRELYGGPILVMKGPEVAASYPDPVLRGFGDVDVLVEDPFALQRTLVAAGFTPVGDPDLYVGIHHLRPLILDGLPLAVEVHARPKWLDRVNAPVTAELFEASVASSTGIDGIRALPPERHALVLAVHSWAHEPLRRLRDIVDVAMVTAAADRTQIRALARRWNVERLWSTTIGASDALLGDAPTPWALRLWAQNLAHARERTVLETHLQAWLSDFWALPAEQAIRELPLTLADEVGRKADEGWGRKLSRTAMAVRNAARRRSLHDSQLEEERRR